MKKLLGVLAVMFLVGCIPPQHFAASQVLVIEYRSVGYRGVGYGYDYVSPRYYSPYYYGSMASHRHVERTRNYVTRTSSRSPKHSNKVKQTTYRKRQSVVSRPSTQVRPQPQRRRTSSRRRN